MIRALRLSSRPVVILGAAGVALLVGATFTGCQSRPVMSREAADAQGLLNSKCPMMPEHGIDPAVTVGHRGGRVGFCCNHCVQEWDRLSDSAKDARLARAK